jgi:hypothetical protein
MAWWLEHRANCRTHRMTKRVPAEVLLEERPSLQPLPVHPYDDRELGYRLVDSYGYIDFDANHYRAPVPIGRWIYVRASEDEVAIVADAANVVVTHPRAPRGEGQYVPPPSPRRRRRSKSELLGCLESWSEPALRYGEWIAKRKRFARAELAHIVALQQSYSIEDILAAIEHASRYGAYGARELGRILQVKAKPRSFEDQLASSARQHIRRAMDHSPVRQRSLSAYAELLTGPEREAEPSADRGSDDRKDET